MKLRPDDVRGESAYQDDLPEIVAELKSAGIAVESEGAVVVHVPGYESPLMIQKTDGGYLYGTTDLAAIRYRIMISRRIESSIPTTAANRNISPKYSGPQERWAGPRTSSWNTPPSERYLAKMAGRFRTRGGGTVRLKDLLDEAEERALKIVTRKTTRI